MPGYAERRCSRNASLKATNCVAEKSAVVSQRLVISIMSCEDPFAAENPSFDVQKSKPGSHEASKKVAKEALSIGKKTGSFLVAPPPEKI